MTLWPAAAYLAAHETRRDRVAVGLAGRAGQAGVVEGGLGLLGRGAAEVGHGDRLEAEADDVAHGRAGRDALAGRGILAAHETRRDRVAVGLAGRAGQAGVVEGGLGLLGRGAAEVGHGDRLEAEADDVAHGRAGRDALAGRGILAAHETRRDRVAVGLAGRAGQAGVVEGGLGLLGRGAAEVGHGDRLEAEADDVAHGRAGRDALAGRGILAAHETRRDRVAVGLAGRAGQAGVVEGGLGLLGRGAAEVGHGDRLEAEADDVAHGRAGRDALAGRGILAAHETRRDRVAVGLAGRAGQAGVVEGGLGLLGRGAAEVGHGDRLEAEADDVAHGRAGRDALAGRGSWPLTRPAATVSL